MAKFFGKDQLAPWSDNANSVLLASTLLVHRNIEKFNFPAKLAPDRRKQIVALIGKEMANLKEFEEPTLLKSEECSPLDKEFLVEHCLTHEGFLQAVQGEAFVYDQKGVCLLTINIDDHLHLHYIDVKGELEKGWNTLVSIESTLGKLISYSYSPKFGFLTSNPFYCGTGLSVSLYMQLSGLIHSGKINETLSRFKDEAISINGLYGNPKELVGDLVVLTNNYALGVNEENIISNLRNFSTKLLVEESTTRQNIKDQGKADIKDKVARAYGILIHSYQIETLEALNEIALLKLGIEMEWVKGISIQELNKLFFSCRRGHLLKTFSEKIAIEDVSHKRAEFIHQALKNVTLTI